MTDESTTEPPAPRRHPGPLRLGGSEFGPQRRLVMAIVNRTPDSFYRPGVTWDEGAALARVHEVVAEGADIVDVGGVPAKPGEEVAAAEEIRRVVPFIEAVHAAYPGLVISVDTWRHDVGRAACEAGASLLNDTWGGWDPKLPEVAAELGAGLVCSHAGGLPPRTRPFRVRYDDVVADVLATVLGLAGRALRAGVDQARIVIDPAHDFGKNSWHSLEVTRRLGELTATGWPVLLSASRKDFVGETLGRHRGPTGRNAGDDGGRGMARRAYLPRPRRRADPAGARHGGGDQGGPAARSPAQGAGMSEPWAGSRARCTS